MDLDVSKFPLNSDCNACIRLGVKAEKTWDQL